MINTASTTLDRPLVIGHRGAPLFAFENTLASFRKAIAQGAQAIELDVQVTRDRQLVVFHDVNIDRLTRGSGLVRYFDLADLRKFVLNGIEHIPTLSEVFDAFEGQVQFFVELKWKAEGIDLVLETLVEHGALESALVCSFDKKGLEHARELSSDVSLGYLRWAVMPKDIAFAKATNLQAIHPNHGFLTEHVVREAHAAGLKVYTWTPDWSWEVRRMLRMGVDGVITNRTPAAVQVVEKRYGRAQAA